MFLLTLTAKGDEHGGLTFKQLHTEKPDRVAVMGVVESKESLALATLLPDYLVYNESLRLCGLVVGWYTCEELVPV